MKKEKKKKRKEIVGRKGRANGIIILGKKKFLYVVTLEVLRFIV